MKPLPIRVRLTLWYFAMFASAAALLCLSCLWMLQRSVDATEYHDLQERAQDVQEVLDHQGAEATAQTIADRFTEIYSFKDDGKYLQVRDDRGNWVYRSKRMIAENPNLPAPGSLPPQGIITEFNQGIHHIRILSYPIVAGGRHYSVQTGIAMNKSLALLAVFRRNLLFLTPAVILLAAAGGHTMSRKALRPVAMLSAEARRITDRNLDSRLPVSMAGDEISDLSRTLNEMLERIDKAFASVRAFTGNASHELRTPISLLRAEIEVALFLPRSSEDYRDTLAHLHEETVRMANTVENMLSLARTDAGAEKVELVPISVERLLRNEIQTWKDAMRKAGLDFRVDLPEDKLYVLGDESNIRQLLSILLENAVKFTPNGGSIILSYEMHADQVTFSVRDTGLGIAPEHIPHLFERFYRVASNGESSRPGSGLGLSLAKWIVDRHRTELQVESSLGLGSCFSFSLDQHNPVDEAIDVLSSSFSHRS